MTLIVGLKNKRNVVVRADGYSTRTSDRGKQITARDLQKVFASRNLPIAVAHHGTNILEAQPVAKLIEDWLEGECSKIWRSGLNSTACTFANDFDQVVSRVLAASKHRKGFGVWFAGWWPCSGVPEIFEVFWKKYAPDRIRVHTLSFAGDFVWCGSGKEFAAQAYRENAAHLKANSVASLAESEAFCDQWYQRSLEVQKGTGEDLVGGNWTQVAISKDRAEI